MSAVLQLTNINHSFGSKRVLVEENLTLDKGNYVLRGKNGCGKSTLLKISSGILNPSAGSVRVGGHDMQANPLQAKQLLTYIPDSVPVYSYIQGLEFLDVMISLTSRGTLKRAHELVERFGISEFCDTRFSQMSLGTQRKFMLSYALNGSVQLIVLDEPTNGLDTDSQSVLVDLLNEKKLESTCLLSSHDSGIAELIDGAVLDMRGVIET